MGWPCWELPAVHWHRNSRHFWWCCMTGSPAPVVPKAVLTDLRLAVSKDVSRLSLAFITESQHDQYPLTFKRSAPNPCTHWIFILSVISFKFCWKYFIRCFGWWFVFLITFISTPNQSSLFLLLVVPGWHWHLNVNNLACPGGSFVVSVTPLNKTRNFKKAIVTWSKYQPNYLW